MMRIWTARVLLLAGLLLPVAMSACDSSYDPTRFKGAGSVAPSSMAAGAWKIVFAPTTWEIGQSHSTKWQFEGAPDMHDVVVVFRIAETERAFVESVCADNTNIDAVLAKGAGSRKEITWAWNGSMKDAWEVRQTPTGLVLAPKAGSHRTPSLSLESSEKYHLTITVNPITSRSDCASVRASVQVEIETTRLGSVP